MVITRESAIWSSEKLGSWKMMVCFKTGKLAGTRMDAYHPTGDMWDQYDYYRGYEVGELWFEEANLGLLEGDDV